MSCNYRAGYFPFSPPDTLSTLLCGPSLAPHWVQPMGDPSWRPEGGRRERGWGSYSPRSLSAGQWCGHGSFPLLKVAGWWWLSPVATALLITAPSPCHSRPRGGQLPVPECLIIPRCFYYPHFGPLFSSHHSPLVHVPSSLSCPDPGWHNYFHGSF